MHLVLELATLRVVTRRVNDGALLRSDTSIRASKGKAIRAINALTSEGGTLWTSGGGDDGAAYGLAQLFFNVI